MNGLWNQAALATGAAFLVVLVAIPLLRHVALALDLVDGPSDRKVHIAPTPYLGGVAVFLGIGISVALIASLDTAGRVLVLASGAACALGLVDDQRNLSPRVRIVAEMLLATAVAVGGVRLRVTGHDLIDALLTVVFLLGATNALNLCDNMDALAGGLAIVAVASTAAIGALLGNASLVVLSVAVVGALAGYLVFNGPPATIFMGDSGSLMLGFLVGGLLCVASDAAGGAVRSLTALLPLAVVFLDTATVVVARPRNGRRLIDAGKDHLSHRLALLGLGKERAVLVLVLQSAAISTLGVLAAGGRLAPIAALAVAALVAAPLALVCWVAPVYSAGSSPAPTVVDLRERRATTSPRERAGLTAERTG